MKKRFISLALAIILTVGCLMPQAVHADIRGDSDYTDLTTDFYIFPDAYVNDAVIVQGSNSTFTFHANLDSRFGYADFCCVEVYRGSLEQLDKQIRQGKEPELMDFFYVSVDEYWEKNVMSVQLKTGSRYTVGDYSLVCYLYDAETKTTYDDRYLFWTEFHVVKEKRTATGFSLWCMKDDGWEQILEDSILTTPDAPLCFVILPEPYLSSGLPKWSVNTTPYYVLGKQNIHNSYGYCVFDVYDSGIAHVSVICGKQTLTFWLKNGTFDETKELKIYRDKTTLCVGEEDKCEVRSKQNYNVYPTGAVWTSSDPSIATVGTRGEVKALKPGKVQITATAANYKETVEYTVQYHQLPEGTPVSTRTATQPKQAIGHCSACGKDDAINVYEPAIFTDTVWNSWYAEHVDKVYDKGLMNGTGEHTFAPNANVTRAMAATVLYRIAGSPEVEEESPFNDVPEGKYYTNAVIWAQQNEVVNGYPDGTFRPNDNITREQLAAILYRYAKAGGNAQESDADLSAFPDSGKVHSYAAEAMGWAVGAGLINGVGSGGQSWLQPANNATRAQFATIISRYLTALEAAQEQEPPENTDTVKPDPVSPK